MNPLVRCRRGCVFLLLVLVAGAVHGQVCTITCPGNITDSNDLDLCGAVTVYAAPTGDCDSVVCSPLSGSFFPVGTTTVTCTGFVEPVPATGPLPGEIGGTCMFTVTINDTQPPTVMCPADASDVSPNGLPVVVLFDPASAADNCPGVSAAIVPPSGSSFPVGITTGTCTATDASGNTATDSMLVTIGLPTQAIPTLSTWGVALLVLAMLGLGVRLLR